MPDAPNPQAAFERAVSDGLGAWPAGTVFLAAVSGGADSTAMLAALASLRERAGFRLHTLHVEHGIRDAAESQADAQAVEALCERLSVPCRVVSIKPGQIARAAQAWGSGIEAAARHFRRQAWQREAARVGAARVLVAHTQDDMLETTLMRVLRGVGPAGLAIMPREKGQILRPLLGLTRNAVLAYLAERGFSHQSDATNRDIRYLRNRVRHKLIPCLDAFFPEWRTPLTHLAETQRLVADVLDASVRDVPCEALDDGSMRFDADVFFALPLLLREETLFKAADALADRDPRMGQEVKRANVRRFSEGGLLAMDAGLVRLEKRNQSVYVSLSALTRYRERTYEQGFALVLREAGVYALDGLNIVLADGTLDLNGARKKVQPPLVFRQVKNVRDKGLDRRRSSRYTNSILVEDVQGPLARITNDNEVEFITFGSNDV
jgi:tRNA(Ile)-lysidine synthase